MWTAPVGLWVRLVAFLLMPAQQDHRIEDPLFRVAVVRRLGGWVAAKAGPGSPRHCALIGKDGTVCGRPLGNGGIHANQCKKEGHVIRRHDRVVRWQAGWIEDGIGSQVLVEQAVAAEGEEGDRLDLTLESGGRRLWLDLAIVNVMTINAAERLRRAKLDEAAARHEEGAKRSRYRGLATPFVIEAHGRPGDFARSVISRFAKDSELGNSTDVARAWQSFRPSFSLSLLRLDFGRVGIRLPIGTMSDIIYSLFFSPLGLQQVSTLITVAPARWVMPGI